MLTNKNEATSATLLGLLRQQPPDDAAWKEFDRRYRQRILAFCLAWPLQPADAEDVTQAVMVKLTNRLRTFQYDPTQRFRAWLKAVTRSVICDYLAEQSKRDQGSGDSAILRLLESVAAQDGLAEAVEAEYERELLAEALRRVMPCVPPQHWEAFRLTALEGKSGAEAAAELGMLVATVYTAKSKVQKLVREELLRVEGLLDTPPALG
jgi:RNA polymerase sigma-70 factor (ECF subfamily)